MIRFVTETGSTNTDLASELRAGMAVPEGEWLVADRQVSGRGRQGRAWFDGYGNFMGSTVVHLSPRDPNPATLALVAGVGPSMPHCRIVVTAFDEIGPSLVPCSL